MTESYSDVEGALRTWLRAQAAITALVGQRVFFGVPKAATEAKFPMLTIRRVGGGDSPGDAPVDAALLQIDCWGSIDDSGNGIKSTCTTLVNTLRSVLRQIDGRTVLATGTAAFGVSVESTIWLPDPDNDRPRYIVTVEVTVISS